MKPMRLIALAGSSLATTLAVGAAALALAPADAAAKAQQPARLPGVLNCKGRAQTRPRGAFVLACADGNALIEHTSWSAWTAKEAKGTTTFGLNLCKPYCAASSVSFFPHSAVRLYAARETTSGPVFTRAKILYELHGKRRSFTARLLG